jgi:hypothetical protein
MQRDQLPPSKSSTYVMRRWKAVYVSVNKAACTSLKWLVADLQGERPERFHTSLSREVGRSMTIHKRSLWQHTPMLHELPDDELAAIGPENGWFVFAVVRHPAARVWSAWQSKLLLREPWWVERFGEEPWFPRVPASTEDVVEDFRRFVPAIAAEPDHRIVRNRHLAPQTRMLAPDRVPYSRIYGTREIPLLLEDFDRHLRAQGWSGTLTLPKSNETPLRPLASMFTEPVVDGIRSLYEQDFETFGYDDVLPDGVDTSDRYSDEALAEVARLVERAERINDVILRARRFRRAAVRANKRAAAAEARAQPLWMVKAFARRARKRVAGALPQR